MTGFEIVVPVSFNNALLETVPVYGFSDNFNRADNPNGLGYTSGENKPWKRYNGLTAFGGRVVSNRAVPYDVTGAANGAWGAEVVNANAANGTLKATLVTAGSKFGGLTFRASSNVDFLTLMMRTTGSNSTLVLAKKVANTTTTVATSATQGIATDGSVFEIVLSGTSITVKCNGVVVIPTQTVTELAGNTEHGLYFNQGSMDMVWDDVSFTAA